MMLKPSPSALAIVSVPSWTKTIRAISDKPRPCFTIEPPWGIGAVAPSGETARCQVEFWASSAEPFREVSSSSKMGGLGGRLFAGTIG